MAEDTGLDLDEYFDIVVDSTGDWRTTSQGEELRKDLSGVLWTLMQDLSGQRAETPTSETITATQRVRSVVKNDIRVIEVLDVEITGADSARPNKLDARVRVESIYGPLAVDTRDQEA